MKPKSILTTGVLAAFIALSAGAQAAADTEKGAEAKAQAAADSKMKPHSHVGEKTGMAPKAPDAKTAKADPGKDKSKHSHPRDSK